MSGKVIATTGGCSATNGFLRLNAEARLHLVGGAPRSGTTLLQAVLCGAPEATPLLGEAGFLIPLLDFYGSVRRSWADDAHYFFAELEDAEVIARRTIEAVVAPVADRHRSTEIVMKAPALSTRAAAIAAVLPAARCYAILRDARDVVALQISAGRREVRMGCAPTMLEPAIAAEVRDDRGFWDGWRAIDALTDRFLEHYDEVVLADWHLIQYESLVTRSASVIDGLRAVSGLQIEFDPTRNWQRVEFDYLRSSRTSERAWRSNLWGRPIDASRIGVHKRILSREQVHRIERRAADYLARWAGLSSAEPSVVGDDRT